VITYLVDANVLLRYLLHDNSAQLKVIYQHLAKVKEGKAKIVVLSEVIPEVEYVLRKVYKVVRAEIADKLMSILKTTYLDVEKKKEWLEALVYYTKYNIDPVDALLFIQAKERGLVVLSFDEDFKKLKRYERRNI